MVTAITYSSVIRVSQDVPVGSFVFHVVGMDPDDPFTPEGQIQYYFLKNSPDIDAFNIGQSRIYPLSSNPSKKFLTCVIFFLDSKSGLITTRMKLNRELKSNYSLILVIKDGGVIPQQATKVFQIRVNDTDDNIPMFKRAVVSLRAKLSTSLTRKSV